MRHVERMVLVIAGSVMQAREEPIASITLARRERGPDPTESPYVDRKPKQTWDRDPVRNRRVRNGWGKGYP